VSEVDAQDVINWDSQEWKSEDEAVFERGRIHYYSMNTEVCNSWVIVPGTAILPRGLLAIGYGFTLIYLFLGIGIISDVFMSAIEKITSKKQLITHELPDGTSFNTEVMFWNPTVANLTLMALGSSAPEILLSVIETMSGLGKCPGELGASTIVGSAAFNLLVISGVSIYAVSEENDISEDRDPSVPKGAKKINDMGVFAITGISSLWAYIWLFIVVGDNAVEPWEAWLTIIFFFILIIMAFAADKYNTSKNGGDNMGEQEKLLSEYQAVEIYRELIRE